MEQDGKTMFGRERLNNLRQRIRERTSPEMVGFFHVYTQKPRLLLFCLYDRDRANLQDGTDEIKKNKSPVYQKKEGER